MNKYISGFIKFTVVFFVMTYFPIKAYYKYFPSQTQKKLNLFSDDLIRKTCHKSPMPQAYQVCFRLKLSSVITKANPLEVLNILDLIKEIKERDLLQARSEQERFTQEVHYFQNWSIFIDYLTKFQLRRDHIDFFQIILLPIAKNIIRDDIIELKGEREAFLVRFKGYPIPPLLKRNLEKINRISIKIL